VEKGCGFGYHFVTGTKRFHEATAFLIQRAARKLSGLLLIFVVPGGSMSQKCQTRAASKPPKIAASNAVAAVYEWSTL
jgi:hypothetical protein